MATVFIPTSLQKLTGGQDKIVLPGSTVRQIVNNLEAAFPGTKERLVDGFKIKSNMSVAVDGEISPLGLLEKVGEDSEVHFVAAIGGGAFLLLVL
jgi:molybdopterin synthase sulfur carrier subunit